jgi:hypothetical protein
LLLCRAAPSPIQTGRATGEPTSGGVRGRGSLFDARRGAGDRKAHTGAVGAERAVGGADPTREAREAHVWGRVARDAREPREGDIAV